MSKIVVGQYPNYEHEIELPPGVQPGDVSDGYHSFNELYDHRCLLFIGLCLSNKEISFWTEKNKEGDKWDGWFILGMNFPDGQITYHISNKLLSLVKDKIQEIERNFNYDGHNSKDILDRLTQFCQKL